MKTLNHIAMASAAPKGADVCACAFGDRTIHAVPVFS